MLSRITPEFLRLYRQLDPEIRRKVLRAHKLFLNNPRHGSLRFKRVKGRRYVYSARIDENFRVLGELNGDTITWHWIGPHNQYDRMIS